MRILVTGGAGYIGSHMTLMLVEGGHEVAVLDNLSGGHRDAVLGVPLIEGDIGDESLLDRLFTERRFDAVMHFASYIQVGESVIQPEKYYRNNIGHTLVLLGAMLKHGVKALIFSSTAAIFGEPEYIPIDEAHPQNPLNPYGRSKLAVEEVLADFDRAYGFKYATLRYFNAAGADPRARLGERHAPETHLIPLALRAAMGTGPMLTVFGRDYETPDGTCIRDYIHINDLCLAHLLALEALLDGGQSCAYNLGNGCGFSVLEVIEAVQRVTGKGVPLRDGPRRPGDPARLVADSRGIQSRLGWRAQYPELDVIVRHAFEWEQVHAKTRRSSR